MLHFIIKMILLYLIYNHKQELSHDKANPPRYYIASVKEATFNTKKEEQPNTKCPLSYSSLNVSGIFK